MKYLTHFIVSLFLCLSASKGFSQNYGDFYYTQKDFEHFRFFVKLVRDCEAEGNSVDKTLHIVDLFSRTETHNPLVLDSAVLVKEANDPCMILPDLPCRKIFYLHADLELVPDVWGYSVAYFSCCRNFDNLAINNGNPTTETAAYVLWMLPKIQNNSAVFVNDTILNVCINKPFSYAFNALDPDGDSLVYNFSNPKNYELSPDRSGNWTVIEHKPPYPDLNYAFPYAVSKPIGDVSIDPATGSVSGTLQHTGTFLLTVNVDEYRNQVKIASHQKEIVVRSVDCSVLPPARAALPDLFNDCKAYSVHFPNHSNAPLGHYLWYFGDGDSTQGFEPDHVYKDTGTYWVKMVMNKGYYCADSVSSRVLVYPSLKSQFIHMDSCAGLPVSFKDISTTTYGKIVNTRWNIENSAGSMEEKFGSSIEQVFSKGEKSYLVRLQSQNSLGCAAVDSQYVDVYDTPEKLPVHDTILSLGSTLAIPTAASSASNTDHFLWSPGIGLNDIHMENPLVVYNKDITYTVEVSNHFGCQRKDSIHIRYFKGPHVYVPNAFTPNHDGLNDVFSFTPVGMKSLGYFRIYNRWGEKLFETTTSRKGWDGRWKGVDVPAGVYIWELNAIDEYNQHIIDKGTVLLIR
ncbi:MAG: T9SS type B sorting domain-containing protein [Flavisolibacter sp.]